jgi:hypothetical protein
MGSKQGENKTREWPPQWRLSPDAVEKLFRGRLAGIDLHRSEIGFLSKRHSDRSAILNVYSYNASVFPGFFYPHTDCHWSD